MAFLKSSLCSHARRPSVSLASERRLIHSRLDHEPIEVRQLDAGGVLHPEVRVLRQDHAPARRKLGEHERPQPGHLGRGRRRAPRLAEPAHVERRLELVTRKDREPVEDAQARTEGRWEADHDRLGIGRRHHERLASDFEFPGKHAGRAFVVDHAEGEEHVGRRERLTVREPDVGPELQRVRQPVVCKRPTLSQPRLDLVAHPIEPDEPGRGQPGEQLVGGERLDVTVERGWFAPVRRDQRSAAGRDGWCCRGSLRARQVPESCRNDNASQDNSYEDLRSSGHSLPHWSIACPIAGDTHIWRYRGYQLPRTIGIAGQVN